ncbi:MAG: 30S ribosomal protein S20 [Planctomycetaceae bacterium]
MPNTAAATKYLRHSQKTRLRNRSQRSELRGRLKKFRELMAGTPTQEEADKAFSAMCKALDQAAAKRLIHKNASSRTKSRLAALKKKVFVK